MSNFEERNATTTLTSYYPSLNVIRQVPAATYVANSTVYGGQINFAARVPGASSITDIGSMLVVSQNATSTIQFLTRTGMTNGNSGTGTLGVNMSLTGNVLYIGSLAGGASGVLVDANGNLIRGVSDIRFKKDIVPIDHALNKVMQLKGVYYNFKDTARFGSQHQIGFIAQDIEKVVPEVVVNGKEYKSVNYQYLTALLAEAIKEQQQQIETLKTSNNLLMEKSRQVEYELEELMKRVGKLDFLKTTTADAAE